MMLQPDPISRRLARGAGTHGPLVLVYHAITPGRQKPLWPYAVSIDAFKGHMDYLAAEGWLTVPVSELDVTRQYPSRTIAITFDDGYENNLLAAEALTVRGMCATWFVVTAHIGTFADWPGSDHPNAPMLKRSHLLDMREQRFEVGSHTRSHVRLAGASPAVLHEQIPGSKSELEDVLGISVGSFAYPYGVSDLVVEAAIRAAEFKQACTTSTGWALRDHDPYRIRRLTIFSTDTVSHLARKLAFADNRIGLGAVGRYTASRLVSRVRGIIG